MLLNDTPSRTNAEPHISALANDLRSGGDGYDML
jgi:hypothetical protein